MATYGDGLSDVDIHALLDFHKRHGKLVTVTGVLRPPSYFGELKIDGDRVEEFFEKPQMRGFINGGFYVFNRRIFDYLNEADDCDLEYGPLEQIVKEGQLMVYKHTGFWSCMDTLRDLQKLEKLWNEGKAGWKALVMRGILQDPRHEEKSFPEGAIAFFLLFVLAPLRGSSLSTGRISMFPISVIPDLMRGSGVSASTIWMMNGRSLSLQCTSRGIRF